MSSGQSQKSNADQSFSFEDVSKLFALPLSEAADILGVPTSVLKKICNENGLERWPHRKYLAGKSIEEIKKEAAREKSKALGVNSPKSSVTTTSTTSTATTSGSHVKDKSPKSNPEISKPQSNGQHNGSKTMPTWRSHLMVASGLAMDANTIDEFKYGFPSNGLSKCTNRWWGGSSNNGASKENTKTSSEVEDESKEQASDSLSSMSDKQDEGSNISDKQDEVSLSGVRKRAVEEGKKALKLHALKKFGADKLGNEEKILLRKLYQTS
ncbi:Protein RKD2 [Bienertia sinuspersici]